jgi:hypothetical protein
MLEVLTRYIKRNIEVVIKKKSLLFSAVNFGIKSMALIPVKTKFGPASSRIN